MMTIPKRFLETCNYYIHGHPTYIHTSMIDRWFELMGCVFSYAWCVFNVLSLYSIYTMIHIYTYRWLWYSPRMFPPNSRGPCHIQYCNSRHHTWVAVKHFWVFPVASCCLLCYIYIYLCVLEDWVSSLPTSKKDSQWYRFYIDDLIFNNQRYGRVTSKNLIPESQYFLLTKPSFPFLSWFRALKSWIITPNGGKSSQLNAASSRSPRRKAKMRMMMTMTMMTVSLTMMRCQDRDENGIKKIQKETNIWKK